MTETTTLPPRRRQATALTGRIGPFELVAHLASGGMSEVYLARRLGIAGFQRHLVLKLLPLESQRAQIAMFLDEARLVGMLHHRHITEVHEVGVADGHYFLAMEYIHGEPLSLVLAAAVAQGRTLALDFALFATRAVASALQYSHELCGPDGQPLGVVHRDISPSNVIAGYDGGLKLIDFGIARTTTQTDVTAVGYLKGKAGYMAPEYVRGFQLDRRSDVFALGVLLYELTTLRRAYGTDPKLALRRIVNADIVRPANVVPGYPLVLDALVMTALATEPKRRFGSAEVMIDAIETTARQLRLELGDAAIARTLESLFGRRAEPWLIVRPNRLARGTEGPPATPASDPEIVVESDALADDDDDVDDRPTIALGERAAAELAARATRRGFGPSAPPPPAPATPPPRRRWIPIVLAAACALLCLLVVTLVWSEPRNVDEPLATTVVVLPTNAPPPPAPLAPPAAPTPRLAELNVTSEPTGAIVELDGVRQGVTPLVIARPSGAPALAVRLRRAGFRSHTSSIDLVRDLKLHIKLMRCPLRDRSCR